MKNLFLSLCFILVAYSSAEAQKTKYEELKAYKTAYLTEQLDLTPKEAEKFWPIYNANHKKMMELKHEYIKKDLKAIKESGGIDVISNEDAQKYVDRILKYNTEEVYLKKEYYKNLKNILSPKKILKLNQAEYDFNRKLLHQYKKNRELKKQK